MLFAVPALKNSFKSLLNDPFTALHLRLLLSYLGVMSSVLGITIIFVYQYFAHNLYNKFDRQLATLADAASHSLPKLRNIDDSMQDLAKRDRIFDNDGDLDIPWQDLHRNQQAIEWFDLNGKLIIRTGNPKIPNLAFNPTNYNALNAEVQTSEKYDDLRSLIIPIYLEGSISNTVFSRVKISNINSQHGLPNGDKNDKDAKHEINNNKELIGYVRVSEPSEEIEEELEGLVLGLGWGGLLAIILSGIGGWWLAWHALQPIERNYKQMRQFTADASHELRSPLTAIKTSIDVIQNHPERIHSADVKKIAAIAQASEQMTKLVEDLLFLARVDNNHLERTAVNAKNSRNLLLISLDELLEDILENLEPQILAKAIDVQLKLDPTIAIHGDANQLRRLFTNLLENAIAYSIDSGKVGIDLAKISPQLIQVAITDTGIGIAQEDLPHIFERFWRADRARNWRTGGTGLGLSIAQAIAKSHHGHITVSSQVGLGSCFTVEFAIG